MSMLPRLAHGGLFLAVTHLCLSLNCPAQQRTVVRLSDQNGQVAISGTMVFTDDESETTPYSFRIQASAKNVSHHPVLFFKVAFPLSSDTSPDPAAQEYEHDYFFSPHALDPASAIDFEVSLEHYGSRVAGSPSPHIRATAKLVFVQFTNGMTWGSDPGAMKDILRARKTTVYELNVLKDAFEKSGDEGFVAEITKTEYSVPALSALQHIYKEEGLEEAKTIAWSMIESAKRRERDIQFYRLSVTPLYVPVDRTNIGLVAFPRLLCLAAVVAGGPLKRGFRLSGAVVDALAGGQRARAAQYFICSQGMGISEL